MEITLPNQWRPRGYQRRLWNYLEGGGKRAVAVWHRRAGKDEVCLHWAACAALQRVGNYWHMLPEASQARKAIWDAINPHTGRRRIERHQQRASRAGGHCQARTRFSGQRHCQRGNHCHRRRGYRTLPDHHGDDADHQLRLRRRGNTSDRRIHERADAHAQCHVVEATRLGQYRDDCR